LHRSGDQIIRINFSALNIQPYNDELKDDLIFVWERSVRATHTFLKREDIDYYKSIVVNINFNEFQVYCALADGGELMGFVGVADGKMEMLFVHPSYLGQGIGKALARYAIDILGARTVDVNEGNRNAAEFYKGLGFEVYDRAEKDSEGKDYPILKMRL
jgi:putative acetyltransferase